MRPMKNPRRKCGDPNVACQPGPIFLPACGEEEHSQPFKTMKFVVRDFRPQLADPKPSLAFQDGTDPKCIFEYYQEAIASEPDYEPDKEHLVIICVTARMRICGWNMVSVGTLTEALVHPREVFRPVIVRGAYGFVVCHNHPTGDPLPSQADIKQTRRLSEGAEILRVRLIDHVIIGTRAPGREPYYSFREGGLI